MRSLLTPDNIIRLRRRRALWLAFVVFDLAAVVLIAVLSFVFLNRGNVAYLIPLDAVLCFVFLALALFGLVEFIIPLGHLYRLAVRYQQAGMEEKEGKLISEKGIFCKEKNPCKVYELDDGSRICEVFVPLDLFEKDLPLEGRYWIHNGMVCAYEA